MPLLSSVSNNTFKKEGTTQTFGQLIVFPTKKDQQSTQSTSPTNTVVRLIQNGQRRS